jgi:DNA-binding transcriptional MerR regulator
MRIGELAKAAGISVQTIRYYERIGLLYPDGRSSAGYRSYEAGAVTFLKHVKHAQRLGFTLAEQKQLFEPREQTNGGERLRRLADTKLRQLTHRIEMLQNMQYEIQQFLEGCGCNHDKPCEVARALLIPRA